MSTLKAPTPQFNGLKLVAIGGLYEFGNQCYAYENENGEILVVDSGRKLLRDKDNGYELPDFSYLETRRSKLLGLLITHAHDDHIGGVADFNKRFPNLPIYTHGKFTTAFANNLLGKGDVEENITPKTIELKPFEEIRIGGFKVEALPVNHSTPDSAMFFIQGGVGKNNAGVLHTGDFRPVDVYGPEETQKRLKELGEKGFVTAVVCDSTGAHMPTKEYIAEQDVVNALMHEIKRLHNKRKPVIVSMFSTNVDRYGLLTEALRKEKLIPKVYGAAMNENVGVAAACGTLAHPIKAGNNLGSKGEVAIVTGTQAEANSVLDKLAHDNLKSGIHIIFSSSIIPGNEEEIIKLKKMLSDKGNTIYDVNNNAAFHQSGHAAADGIAWVLKTTKPSYYVPVHGEEEHFEGARKIGQKTNIETLIFEKNGQALLLDLEMGAVIKDCFEPKNIRVVTENSQKDSKFVQKIMAAKKANRHPTNPFVRIVTDKKQKRNRSFNHRQGR